MKTNLAKQKVYLYKNYAMYIEDVNYLKLKDMNATIQNNHKQ